MTGLIASFTTITYKSIKTTTTCTCNMSLPVGLLNYVILVFSLTSYSRPFVQQTLFFRLASVLLRIFLISTQTAAYMLLNTSVDRSNTDYCKTKKSLLNTVS